jgi:hypothetical protein
MADRDANIAALCENMGVRNPIREDEVKVKVVVFYFYGNKPSNSKVLRVRGTDMNLAGRLFLQSKALGGTTIIQLKLIRPEAAEHFTSVLWDDCSPEKRTIVFGCKEADVAQIIFE